MSTRLKFIASWPGELGAGIHPGYENVEIHFVQTVYLDTDDIEYWRAAIQDFFDGAHVELEGAYGRE